MKIVEITAKSAFVRSKLPDTDYVINPYTGCAFACAYCYASFMGRYVGEEIGDWGDYLYVKTNIPELVENELRRFTQKKKESTLLLSSVTDAWQYAEQKYKITRSVLQSLVRHEYPGKISCLTKSPLILRDADLLKELSCKEVGLTITATEDHISQFLEKRAPKASQRLDALRKLNEIGIPTYAFIGPILPHFYHRREQLRELFKAIAAAGTTSVYIEHLNTSHYIEERLKPLINRQPHNIRQAYQNSKSKEQRKILNQTILQLLQESNLTLKLEEVIEHGEERE